MKLIVQELRTVTNLTITYSDVKSHCFDWLKNKYFKKNTHQTKLKIPSKLNVPYGLDFYLWGKAEKLNSV